MSQVKKVGWKRRLSRQRDVSGTTKEAMKPLQSPSKVNFAVFIIYGISPFNDVFTFDIIKGPLKSVTCMYFYLCKKVFKVNLGRQHAAAGST